MEFPDLDELDQIMTRTITGEAPTVGAVMEKDDIFALRDVVKKVAITPSIQRFALKVLQRTHPTFEEAPDEVKQFVREGASPRGGQSILSTARIHALMRGEPVVAEEDILATIKPSLRHRLILNFEGEAEGIDRDELLDLIVKKTPRT